MPDLGIEPALSRIGNIGRAARNLALFRRVVSSVARSYWAADELVIFSWAMSISPAKPFLDIAACECGVEVAVNVIRQRNCASRSIAPGSNKPRRAQV